MSSDLGVNVSLSIWGAVRPRGGRGVFAGRAFVAHMSPKASGFSLALAGCKNRDRRIIRSSRGNQHVLALSSERCRSGKLFEERHMQVARKEDVHVCMNIYGPANSGVGQANPS
jgi:hypothetical protein